MLLTLILSTPLFLASDGSAAEVGAGQYRMGSVLRAQIASATADAISVLSFKIE